MFAMELSIRIFTSDTVTCIEFKKLAICIMQNLLANQIN